LDQEEEGGEQAEEGEMGSLVEPEGFGDVGSETK